MGTGIYDEHIVIVLPYYNLILPTSKMEMLTAFDCVFEDELKHALVEAGSR